METFNELSRCCKCGGERAYAVYQTRGHDIGKIARRCARCGYVWHEKPLDDKE